MKFLKFIAGFFTTWLSFLFFIIIALILKVIGAITKFFNGGSRTIVSELSDQIEIIYYMVIIALIPLSFIYYKKKKKTLDSYFYGAVFGLAFIIIVPLIGKNISKFYNKPADNGYNMTTSEEYYDKEDDMPIIRNNDNDYESLDNGVLLITTEEATDLNGISLFHAVKSEYEMGKLKLIDQHTYNLEDNGTLICEIKIEPNTWTMTQNDQVYINDNYWMNIADLKSRGYDILTKQKVIDTVYDKTFNTLQYGGLIINSNNIKAPLELSGTILYNKPNGHKIGKMVFDETATKILNRGYSGDNVYMLQLGDDLDLINDTLLPIGLKEDYIKKNWIPINKKDSTITPWTNGVLNVIGNFVEIENGFWIKIDVLNIKGFELITRMDFWIKNTENVLGYYPNSPFLNLYDSASVTSQIIMKMEGDLFDITLINEIKGNWCKVEVNQFISHPCSGGEEKDLIINTYYGWIELMNVNHEFNVNYPEHGC